MQKAFDRIDHRYAMQVVKKLGFSENMIKWFKIIQTGLTAKVIVNSKLTEGINIERCNATYELRQELTARLGIPADGATMRQTILMTYDNKHNKIYTYFRHVALTLRQKGKHARYNAKLAFIRMLDNDKDIT